MKRLAVGALSMVALFGLAPNVVKASYEVQVGYADDLRPSPFFPLPWQGGAGVSTFAGGQSGGYDAGAIRIINTGATPITFNDMTVDSFGDGASFHIWSGFAGTSIAPGDSMILTQTGSFNFDSSDDEGANPAAIPRVTLTIDGATLSYLDTAQVLNTEGTDFLAQHNLNESHQWRDIGTFGGQAGSVPDAGSTAALLGVALAGMATIRNRISKA